MSTYLGTHVAVVPAAMPAPDRYTPRHFAPPPIVHRAVTDVMAAMPHTWTSLADVSWPREAGADHVATGPGGVFVVKVAQWEGELRIEDDVLRIGGRARARVVAAAKDAASAVVRAVPLVDSDDVHAVVCLQSDQIAYGRVRGVTVCTTATLREVLESVPERFAPDQTALVALFIRNALQPRIEPGRHAGRKALRPRLRYGAPGLHAVR